VISEETSVVSVARRGALERGVGVERLKELLAGGPYARVGTPGLETVRP